MSGFNFSVFLVLLAHLQTGRQAVMPGVTGPSFRCGECGRHRATKGRKKTAVGWRCAECAMSRARSKKP